MSVDILRISWDQCVSMVQYCFTFTETMRLVRTDSPGRPPRLSHSSWTMNTGALGLVLFQIVTLSVDYLLELRKQTRRRDWTSFGYTSRFSYNYIYTKTIRHLLQETQANKRSSNRLFLNADQYLPIFLQTTCLNDKHLLGFRGTVIQY